MSSTRAGTTESQAGSASIGANDLLLKANTLPGTQFGVFFHGANQIETPFGDGIRCAGGDIRRFGVIQTTSLGDASYAVDNGHPAHADVLMAGASRNFQFWFRDPIGGPAGFKLTDGLKITFCN